MIFGKSLRSVVFLPRRTKRTIAIVFDIGVCIASVWLAYYLRLGDWIYLSGNQWWSVAAALCAPAVFWAFGLYRAIFRYLGFDALVDLAKACVVFGFLYAGVFTLLGVNGVPRTVGLIEPAMLFLMVGASRGVVRWLLGGDVTNDAEHRVLIYGAGSSGRQLSAALLGSREMRVVGYIDDDPTLHRAVLNGRRIYRPDELPAVVERTDATDILLAMPSITRKRRRDIVELLSPLAIKVRTLPAVIDLASGKVQVSALRPVDIEDLLGRDVAAPNEILFSRNILGKTVLVTGAGGSIGSELCRQIVVAQPAILLLVDLSEFALYSIDEELRRHLPAGSPIRIIPLLASVRDEARMHSIITTWHPYTVYHAAAYKHVPLVEHNPCEGVLNNVFGTLTTVRVAIAANVPNFVLISTDKAVRPTNVMGATKRLAELILQALAVGNQTTRLSMVRFGNVLGSSGSVVPLFRQQIASGGPITVTHADVTRYFMTIPEAAQLVIQAGAMATGGEVFILDMGEPVRVIDLARKMIELSGMAVRDAANPDGDIAIEVVGMRPGEKLYEELLIDAIVSKTAHPLIMKAVESFVPVDVLTIRLTALAAAIEQNDVIATQALLQAVVPEFTPSGSSVDWVALERAG